MASPAKALIDRIWLSAGGAGAYEAGQINGRQFGALVKQTPVIAAGNLVNSALIAVVFWDLASPVFLLSWAGLIWLAMAGRLHRWHRYRARPVPEVASSRALFKATFWAFVLGGLWGLGGWVLFPPESVVHQMFLAFMAGGMAAAAVATMSSLPAACYGFILSSNLPLIVRFAWQAEALSVLMAVIFCFFVGALIVAAHNSFSNTLLQEVALTHGRLSDAVESIPDGLVLYDAERRIVLCNERVKELWPGLAHLFVPGTRYEDLVREAAKHVVCPEGEAAWIAKRTTSRQASSGNFECQLRDGRWLRLSDRPTSDGGLVVAQTDISALRSAVNQAQLANRTKTDFLANMSHELRTPLNAINGFAQMIERETYGVHSSPRYKEYATYILDSGLHLRNVIDDIIDIAKIETGKIDLDEETVDVSEAVETTVRLVRGRAETKRVALSVVLDDDLPMLYADQRLVKQCLINLLGNAVKFTPEGGDVALRAQLDPAGRLQIAVSDTGIGIAQEDIPTALTPFGQVDGDLNRKYEGTGLGLALTKKFMELHGGSVEIESELGSGTSVTLRFPASRVRRPSRGAGPELAGHVADT